ncbi:MAG: T9SS type A sorting domain-containing protein [Bacteroidetes bacterium]|nr:T9SS type A sorting domain-containing protein [Bacteroidota bacterium]
MKSRKSHLIKNLIVCILFSIPVITNAQAGVLDHTFDNDGKVTTLIGDLCEGNAVAIQSDNKIVVAGFADISPYAFAAVRYNTDGSLDNSFDGDGKVTLKVGTGNSRANAVAIQNDGKIVLAGQAVDSSNHVFAVVRFNTDGSLDTTFSNDGIVTTFLGSYLSWAYAIAIQSDGKIVVAGEYDGGNISNLDFTIVRYNTDGSLDNTFDIDGIVITAVTPGNVVDNLHAVAIQSDGKIVVTGETRQLGGTDVDIALVRYNIDGSLDLSFDTDGKVNTAIGVGNHADFGGSVGIQNDGKIIVGGRSFNGSNYDFSLVRYNSNGGLDSTFSADGKMTSPIGSISDLGQSLAVQTDGKILLAGFTEFPLSYPQFALVRFNTDGSIDSSFSNDGICTTSFGNTGAWGYAVDLQSDGRIVVAGTNDYGPYNEIAVARYHAGVLGINDAGSESSSLSIYPNPFNVITTLKVVFFLSDASLRIYNIFGQVVKQVDHLVGHEIKFNRDNIPEGLYYLLLSDKNHIIAQSKFVVSD